MFAVAPVVVACTSGEFSAEDTPQTGAPVPDGPPRQRFDLVTRPFTAELGRYAIVATPLDVGAVLRALNALPGTRAMLVIRERTLSDNTFDVRISLVSGDETVELVTLELFDQPVEGAVPGDLVSSDGSLGHFAIDVTEQLRTLAARADAAPVQLAMEMQARQGEQPSLASFTVVGVSLAVV